MKYSILIPTLNEERYIGNLLDSLTKQTFTDFEVIVCDAKSSDKTKEKVEEFREKLNLTFVEAPKKGVSFQRNYAASLAQAENLMFFDADTWLEPNFIKKVDVFLAKRPTSVLTSWNVPISEKLIDEFMYWAFNLFYLEPMKYAVPAAVGTFIYVNKSAFNAVGGFLEEVVLAEDFDLVKRMFNQGYKYALLRDPKVKFSVRRLDKEGRISFVWKNLRAAFYYHLKGSIKDPHAFKHEFGMFNTDKAHKNLGQHFAIDPKKLVFPLNKIVSLIPLKIKK